MRIVRHDDAHQRAVLGRNILVVKSDVAMESEHASVVVRPELHLAEFDISHDMIDAQNAAIVPASGAAMNPGKNGPL